MFLETLDLSRNQITGLRSLPANLVTLDLSRNMIAALPTEMGSLLKLVELNVSFNQLTCLPPTMSNLTALRSLNASRNLLRSEGIGATLEGITALEELNLDHNPLDESDLPPRTAFLLQRVLWITPSLHSLLFYMVEEGLHVEDREASHRAAGSEHPLESESSVH